MSFYDDPSIYYDETTGPITQTGQLGTDRAREAYLANARYGNRTAPQMKAAPDINAALATDYTNRYTRTDLGAAPQMTAAALGGAPTSQAAGANGLETAESRGMQNAAANLTLNRAMGKAPMQSDLAFNNALNRAGSQARSIAASAQGLNAAQRARLQGSMIGDAQQNLASGYMQNRIAEQQSAEQAAFSAGSQMRGQDVNSAEAMAARQQQTALANQAMSGQYGLAQGQMSQEAASANQRMQGEYGLAQGQMDQNRLAAQMASANQISQFNAGINNTTNQFNANNRQVASQANLEANLRQTGMNDAQIAAMTGQANNRDLATLNAATSAEDIRSRNEIANNQLNADTYQHGVDNLMRLSSGVSGAVGSLASFFSDRKLKTNIKSGKQDIKQFLNALKPYNYEYKDQNMGSGAQLGIMAQDLEKSKLGKQMVLNTSKGKAVAVNSGTVLAALGYLASKIGE